MSYVTRSIVIMFKESGFRFWTLGSVHEKFKIMREMKDNPAFTIVNRKIKKWFIITAICWILGTPCIGIMLYYLSH